MIKREEQVTENESNNLIRFNNLRNNFELHPIEKHSHTHVESYDQVLSFRIHLIQKRKVEIHYYQY